MHLVAVVSCCIFEQGGNVNAIKVIAGATVVTMQGNLAFFGNDTIHFSTLDRADC